MLYIKSISTLSGLRCVIRHCIIFFLSLPCRSWNELSFPYRNFRQFFFNQWLIKLRHYASYNSWAWNVRFFQTQEDFIKFGAVWFPRKTDSPVSCIQTGAPELSVSSSEGEKKSVYYWKVKTSKTYRIPKPLLRGRAFQVLFHRFLSALTFLLFYFFIVLYFCTSASYTTMTCNNCEYMLRHFTCKKLPVCMAI